MFMMFPEDDDFSLFGSSSVSKRIGNDIKKISRASGVMNCLTESKVKSALYDVNNVDYSNTTTDDTMGTSGRIGFADSGIPESVLPTSPAVCTVVSEVVGPNGGGAPAGEDQKATPCHARSRRRA